MIWETIFGVADRGTASRSKRDRATKQTLAFRVWSGLVATYTAKVTTLA